MSLFIPLLGSKYPNPLFSDGSSSPFLAGNIGPQALYDSTTGVAWVGWERGVSAANKRVVSARTYTNSTSTWSPEYTVGMNTLTGDYHGVPVLATVPGSGYCFCFYGAHNSAIQVASNSVANNASVWFDQTAIAGTHTFPNPVGVGTSIYLFDSTTGTDGGSQNTIELIICNPSGSTLNPGTAKKIFYAYNNSGSPGWILPLSVTLNPNGTEIDFLFTYSSTFASTITEIYYARYIISSGIIENYSGSYSVVTGSQPVAYSNLSNFAVGTYTDAGPASLCFDIGGTPHIVYPASTSIGTNAILYHIYGTGSTWSTPEIVYTWPSYVGAQNTDNAALPNSTGGVDIYFGDGGSNYNEGTYGATSAGNMLKISRSSGGTYSQINTILSRTLYGLDNPVPVINGPLKLQVLFCENTSDYTTMSGALKGYAYGNGAFNSPAPIVNSFQTTSFLTRAGSISAAQQAAYIELINGLVADGVFSVLDCLWMFTAQNSTVANLNLISSSYGITVAGTPTFTANSGYSGCSWNNNYLNPGYNPHSAGGNYTQNSASIGAASLVNATDGAIICNISVLDNTPGISYLVPSTGGNCYAEVNGSSDTDSGYAVSSTEDLFVVSRTSSASFAKYQTGVLKQTTAETSAAPANAGLVIGGGYQNQGGFGQWAENIALAFIGGGLTANQVRQLYFRTSIYIYEIAG